MRAYKTDEIGEAILEILSANAKATAEDIARQLDVAESRVSKYIKQFEKDRIILRYKTHVNWMRVRNNQVRALIEVKVIPERGVGFDAVAESIYRYPEVSSVFLLSGSYDLLVQVEGPTLQEVSLFVSEKLATIKNVQSTVTHFLLKKYKEDGDVLVDQPESKRLPMSF
ncbi:MAG TPA: Lrp/AsnC family transcriptional regulator [Spirochaetota bacterium]|jgi:DNA-binding Lrp family transcriptional regulator|nr:Lrp/AsnC family transcriptional regulator [Spirochaetota bacterium]OPZ38884.1 MAG: DNA-binding transcriptional regulator AsnC [Spirochaetes bacterium ADurb.BinA120]HNU91276.1 Lrp/AsnC family transcriptional regulator [Spirochaetota bacterium]HPI13936.1 Lrp/AsnC family transcriptional regulator [Spirochaetota bacterium]HPO44450.1 Lrp/AsnC family transcriptional regulator [Spirochaetota bacterium]